MLIPAESDSLANPTAVPQTPDNLSVKLCITLAPKPNDIKLLSSALSSIPPVVTEYPSENEITILLLSISLRE